MCYYTNMVRKKWEYNKKRKIFSPWDIFITMDYFFRKISLLLPCTHTQKWNFRSQLNCKYFSPIRFPPLRYAYECVWQTSFSSFLSMISSCSRRERKQEELLAFSHYCFPFLHLDTQKLLLPPFIPHFRYSINLI